MAMHFSKEDQEKLKNDKSEIYKKREDKPSKEEIAGLSVKGKIRHFMDYYFKAAMAVVAALCLVIGFIVHTITDRAVCSLYIAVKHDIITEEQVPFVEEAIGEYLGFDPEKEYVTINISSTDQQLQTYFYSGTADILITDEEHFKDWGQAEYFFAAETNKEVAFYGEYEDKYRYRTTYVTGEDVLNNTTKDTLDTEASNATEYNCGLYLTDSEKYRQIGGAHERPVIGIATTTNHLPEAKKFVKFMMDNDKKLTLEEFSME